MKEIARYTGKNLLKIGTDSEGCPVFTDIFGDILPAWEEMDFEADDGIIWAVKDGEWEERIER